MILTFFSYSVPVNFSDHWSEKVIYCLHLGFIWYNANQVH